MLEELLALGHAGAEYDAWLIRISEGDQFGSGFVDVNPNSKIPALLDRSGPEPIRVFESGAILVYLAEKFGAFLPTEAAGARRDAVLAVLADGQRALPRRRLRPFLRLCADQDRICRSTAIAMEVKRQLDVLDRRLAESEYLGGRGLYHRRHGDLALVWRAGQGPGSMAPASSSRCRSTRTSSAGPTRSARGRR